MRPLWRAVPIELARQVHQMAETEKSQNGFYQPKFFSAHQYRTLRTLCETIIPTDEGSSGAIEAGAPEFIDLLTSENQEYQLGLGGGLMWLDSVCTDRFSKSYLDCSGDEQKQMIDLIAYRKSTENDPGLGPGIEFFSLLRMLTVDGFFTSRIGIRYLGYIGNTRLAEFPGCPAVPEV